MRLKTIDGVDLRNKLVLYRAPYDIEPVTVNGIPTLTDTSRISATLPTLQKLIANNCRIVVLTWIGRPHGQIVDFLRTNLVATELSRQLNLPVKKINDCIGPEVQFAISALKNSEILMLENVRFYKEEEDNDDNFAEQLTTGYDLCVFDAFPQSHRDCASTTGIEKHLPTVAGLYLQSEVEHLKPLLQNPDHPFTLIIGGAKISDKLGVINNLLGVVDNILIGGASANPLLAFSGADIQDSLTETIEKPIWFNSPKVHLPEDYVIENQKILDIGPKTVNGFSSIISQSKTVLWSGPMGLFENPQFAVGTIGVAKAITNSSATSIVGGGDTIAFINKYSSTHNFSFVSLAGGAMLEFLSGKSLPALEPLIIR